MEVTLGHRREAEMQPREERRAVGRPEGSPGVSGGRKREKGRDEGSKSCRSTHPGCA